MQISCHIVNRDSTGTWFRRLKAITAPYLLRHWSLQVGIVGYVGVCWEEVCPALWQLIECFVCGVVIVIFLEDRGWYKVAPHLTCKHSALLYYADPILLTWQIHWYSIYGKLITLHPIPVLWCQWTNNTRHKRCLTVCKMNAPWFSRGV